MTHAKPEILEELIMAQFKEIGLCNQISDKCYR